MSIRGPTHSPFSIVSTENFENKSLDVTAGNYLSSLEQSEKTYNETKHNIKKLKTEQENQYQKLKGDFSDKMQYYGKPNSDVDKIRIEDEKSMIVQENYIAILGTITMAIVLVGAFVLSSASDK